MRGYRGLPTDTRIEWRLDARQRQLRTDAAVVVAGGATGQRTANASLTIPNATSLSGEAFYAQWAQFDFASGASLPITTSQAGIVVIR